MTKPIRITLIDCDAQFRQKLVEELVDERLQVEPASDEKELFELLQSAQRPYELVLVGKLDDPRLKKDIRIKIRAQWPTIGIISLTNPEDAGYIDLQTAPSVFCSVDRLADIKTIAAWIQLVTQYRAEYQRGLRLQTLISAPMRVVDYKDEEHLYLQLYEDLFELLPGLDGLLIAHYHEQTDEVSFPFSYKQTKRIHIPARKGGNSITEYIIRNKKPLLIPHGDEIFRQQHDLDSPAENLGYSSSEIGVPMFLEGGKIFGAVIASTNDSTIQYTEEHLQVLIAFTSQATLTIRSFIQVNEANQLRDATATLAAQRSRDGVLQAIVEGAHNIVNSDFTGLILLDDDGSLKKAQPVIPEKFFYMFGEPRQYGGLTRAIINSRRPLNIPDTGKYQLVKDSVREAGIKSMMVFPLIHRDRVLGVLYTHTFTARDFITRDMALWSAYATQAAGALDRVYEEERRIRDYQRLVVELGRLEEPLDLDESLVRIATAAKSVFNSDTCRLFYIDPPTGKVVSSAWAEGDQAEYHIEKEPRRKGSTYHVLTTKKPYFFPDMNDGPKPMRPLLATGLKSAASLPLHFNGRDIGVLHCNNFNRKVTYNEHYQTLLEAFGARAAVVLNRVAHTYKSNVWLGFDREIINCNDVNQLYRLFTKRANKALGADFSVFYPYDPTSLDASRLPLDDDCVRVGEMRNSWQRPRGGTRGGVFAEISSQRSILIVNKLDNQSGKYSSNLARREGVHAFVAMRLDVIMPETEEPNLAGILFLNFRQPTFLRETDLADIRSASELVAASILRLSLQSELQQAYTQRNRQLRAVIEIFQTHEIKKQDLNLNYIANHAVHSLGLDVCTIIEFDPVTQKFTGRGNYGLLDPEYKNVTLRSQFTDEYMRSDGPTVIPDVDQDSLMKSSKFIRREDIRSTVVCPLRVEGDSLGLIFGNYRKVTMPSREDLESFGLFADVAAHVLHRANLESKFNESQLMAERRRLLVWVSMVEDMWQHTLVQKATSIRYYAQTLRKQLELKKPVIESMPTAHEIIVEIDRLAADIANAPPRVPHDSEMKSEWVPIGSLLQEVAAREKRSRRLRNKTMHEISVSVKGLGGAQVYGYRRWLIYIFECLFNNAYNAMPKSGKITIVGRKQRKWAEIRITDTGKGIPRSLQDEIFKVPITGKRNHKGLGIGSVLVTTLVEEHQGTVELERPGPGDTTVLLRLPIGKQAKKE